MVATLCMQLNVMTYAAVMLLAHNATTTQCGRYMFMHNGGIGGFSHIVRDLLQRLGKRSCALYTLEHALFKHRNVRILILLHRTYFVTSSLHIVYHIIPCVLYFILHEFNAQTHLDTRGS